MVIPADLDTKKVRDHCWFRDQVSHMYCHELKEYTVVGRHRIPEYTFTTAWAEKYFKYRYKGLGKCDKNVSGRAWANEHEPARPQPRETGSNCTHGCITVEVGKYTDKIN